MNSIERLIEINAKLLDGQTPGLRDSEDICVAKTGEIVRFAPVSDIVHSIEKTMTLLEDSLTKAASTAELCEALALFWIRFIGIHPFQDGNDRTAKYIIEQKIKERGLSVNFEGIDRFSMGSNFALNLSILTGLFEAALSEQKQTSQN